MGNHNGPSGLGWMFNGATNIFNGWRQRKFQKVENEKQREFQLELEESRRAVQEKIREIEWERNKRIKEEDRAFQMELTYKGMKERRELTLLNAMLSRETAVCNLIAAEDIKNFPLRTSANDILISYPNLPYRPLKIILIPPEFPDNPIFESADKYIIEEVGKKIHKYYGEQFLVEYLGDNWLAPYKGEAAIRKIFNQLSKEPMLIADLNLTREYISLIVYYWNVGYESYQKEIVIENLPIMPILNYYKTKSEHKEILKKDVDDSLNMLSILSTVVVSMITDTHLYISEIKDSPVLLKHMSELLYTLPNSESVDLRNTLINWVTKSYKDTMENMRCMYIEVDTENGKIENQSLEDPKSSIKTYLELSAFFYELKEIEKARVYLGKSIDDWCELHTITNSQFNEYVKDGKLFSVCSLKYDEYFFSALSSIYLNFNDVKNNYEIIGKIIDMWVEEKKKYIL